MTIARFLSVAVLVLLCLGCASEECKERILVPSENLYTANISRTYDVCGSAPTHAAGVAATGFTFEESTGTIPMECPCFLASVTAQQGIVGEIMASTVEIQLEPANASTVVITYPDGRQLTYSYTQWKTDQEELPVEPESTEG